MGDLSTLKTGGGGYRDPSISSCTDVIDSFSLSFEDSGP